MAYCPVASVARGAFRLNCQNPCERPLFRVGSGKPCNGECWLDSSVNQDRWNAGIVALSTITVVC